MLEVNVQKILGTCNSIATSPANTNHFRNISSGEAEMSCSIGFNCQRFPISMLIIAFIKVLKMNKGIETRMELTFG